MFSYIPPDVIEMELVKKNMALNIKNKVPMKTVIGNGDVPFSLFAFTLDPTQRNGYRIFCHNLRDADAKSVSTDELPAGFYCIVQSKAGNFFAIRSGIGASFHPKALENAGLNKSQTNALAGGELFVGPNGKMLLFNASSGGYHPATTTNYISDSKASRASQLAKIGLPVALIVGDHKVFGTEEMLGIEKVFFENNGSWNSRRASKSDYQGAENELQGLIKSHTEDMFFSPEVIRGLDEPSTAFLVCVVEGVKELNNVLSVSDAKKDFSPSQNFSPTMFSRIELRVVDVASEEIADAKNKDKINLNNKKIS